MINIIIGLINLANNVVNPKKIIFIKFKKDGFMQEIVIKKALNNINIISTTPKKLKYNRIKKIIKKIADNCMPKLLLLIIVVF